MYDRVIECIRALMGTSLERRYAALVATGLIYLIVAAMWGARLVVVNRKKVSRIEFEVKEWEERKRRAVELRDRKLYERIMREKPRIDKLKADLELEKLKATVAGIALWFAVFKVLWDAIGAAPIGLIASPIGYVEIPFYAWYILNSFWSGLILDRLMRIFKKSRNEA